ncbi:hypothetical protein [Rodentibacter trehalosifermentans]|uniref:Pentapeptide MXKDX repeat protein n=1 Tax=Rodentibacter trehalosifermentans TaxID=1908263 RepID=A0A1V3IMI0_9PAST|nr:hypothetical protein [Rodentibacter trehalosifermentans]OOF43142.1 hypothetical protein BKK51_11995 [Rodentibacter trehalosifermentans]OOF47554.1 hypothetical protein BKK52_08750 [Rodentibacter trehalosifermentans]OOF51871.1 hypothetical protein BKK53_06875 [Rodentibacter trehalosifermentans]
MKNITLKSTLVSIAILFGATSVYASSMQTDCVKDKMGCEKSMPMKSDSMMKDEMKMGSDSMMKDNMKMKQGDMMEEMKSDKMMKDEMKKDKM